MRIISESWPAGTLRSTFGAFSLGAACLLGSYAWAGGDLPSKFLGRETVGNTRHNMTQRQTSGGGPSGVNMDPYRADYGEVCVYCHTPHGASAAQLPLWNRTIKATTYSTYGDQNTNGVTGDVTQPGWNSLSCLSCHDGQTAIDSIINMPGSGRYRAEQATSQDDSFLNTWDNPSGVGPSVHVSLSTDGCLVCHSPTSGIIGAGAPDFRAFAISTDLRNDHPVGVRYPEINPGVDFGELTGTKGTTKFFDLNGNSRPDSNEVRLYETGEGPEVECASCHDPHGVRSAGPGSSFIPTFLRVNNTGSALCLTCHVK